MISIEEMKNKPWVIFVSNQEEYDLVVKQLLDTGFGFTFGTSYHPKLIGVTNASCYSGDIWEDGLLVNLSDTDKPHPNMKVIKVEFKNTLSIDNMYWGKPKQNVTEELKRQISKLEEIVKTLKGE